MDGGTVGRWMMFIRFERTLDLGWKASRAETPGEASTSGQLAHFVALS